VGFPPLRTSGKWSRSSLRLNTLNLNSRASYRHGGRGSLPTDSVVTASFKALMGEAPVTQSVTEPLSTQQFSLVTCMIAMFLCVRNYFSMVACSITRGMDYNVSASF
jgi:hypothetical protein